MRNCNKGQGAVGGLRGASLAVGMVLAKPEKFMYSCQVRCMHVLVTTPGQRARVKSEFLTLKLGSYS